MRKITLEEVKTIQMDILDSVDRFCADNEIRYSIACGTMLGAIRHGGYIPWDDDIDIYMLREDYSRFVKSFPENYLHHYCLASIERTSNWHLAFAKVYDNRTVVIEKKMSTTEIGVNIDVFVVDNIPDDEQEWLTFNSKRRKMYRTLQHSMLKPSESFSIFKNLLIEMLKIRFIFFNKDNEIRKFSEFIQRYNSQPCKRVFETSSGMMCKQPFPRALFEHISRIKFEDRSYMGFEDFNTYLSAVYGPTYMTPPPPKNRTSYHVTDSFWK